jgi:iron complex transport system substrate-binding protein
LQQIERVYGGRRKIRAFQLIWDQPLMTVNRDHIISDVLESCGGTNVFASAPSLTPVISEESLVEAEPQAIISSVPLERVQVRMNILQHAFPNISAIRNKHLFFVSPDLIHRQTVRVLEAAQMVCEQLESIRSVGKMESTMESA